MTEQTSIKQCTIKRDIRAMGIGLHTGAKLNLTLRPAEPNTGIIFRRVDLEPMVEIPAIVENVGDASRATILSANGAQISTVEHLLSALAGLGVDNIIIDIDGPEIPIMDGSAGPFVFLIQSVGLKEQDLDKEFLRIKKRIKVSNGDQWAVLEPYDGFKVSLELDFAHPVLNKSRQAAVLDFSNMSYVKEVSRARTFGFMSDLKSLQDNNLALGATLDNTVAIGEDTVVNEDGLRYEDEFVKHKVLDAVGDLFLLGKSLIGAFSGYKSGHALNNKLLKELLADKTAWEVISYAQREFPIDYSHPLNLSAVNS